MRPIRRPLQEPSKTDLSSDPDPGRKKDLDPAKDPLFKLDLDPVKIRSDPVPNKNLVVFKRNMCTLPKNNDLKLVKKDKICTDMS